MDAYVYCGLILSCIVVMVDIITDAFTPLQHFLIPSKVITATHPLRQLPTRHHRDHIGSPVALSNSKEIYHVECGVQKNPNATVSVIDRAARRSRQHRRPKKKKSPSRNSSPSITTFPSAGNLPDVYWRAVPMEHLREHPCFVKLPPVVKKLGKLEDARNFRQDTWQWDLLHQGRCTTSQAVAALGFLEEEAGTQLRIPSVWRKGGRGAYERLKQKALRTLPEMEAILCTEEAPPPINIDGRNLWQQSRAEHEVAYYNYRLSDKEIAERKDQAKRFAKSDELAMSIRMMWGNTQEATAMLVALNYFAKQDPGFRLVEVGMCGAGLKLNRTAENWLLLGASPDGVLRHSNGTIEALEVKNHCPFFTNFFKTKKSKHKKRFSVAEMPRGIDTTGGVFSHYVPQLQLEMFCLGEECRSAVMVRLTALGGALLLRMKRDDDWIEEMLYWLQKFQQDYVAVNKKPPKNFFWDTVDRSEQSRYRRFINKTMEVRRSKVEVIAILPNRDIQRLGGPTPMFLD